MPQQYQTVFEIGFKSFPWADMLHAGIVAGIGFAIFRYSRQGLPRILGALGCTFGLIFLSINCIATIPAFVRVRHAFVHGQSSVIEGTVENFKPVPVLGESKESFTVHGVTFSYNVLDNEGCFNDYPPVIRPGLNVRIYYNGACMQRVDVIKPRTEATSSP